MSRSPIAGTLSAVITALAAAAALGGPAARAGGPGVPAAAYLDPFARDECAGEPLGCGKSCLMKARWHAEHPGAALPPHESVTGGLYPSLRPGPPSPSGPSMTTEVPDPTDVLNNSLDIEVVPTPAAGGGWAGGVISGSNTMTIRVAAGVGGGVGEFVFRLAQQFTVGSVTADGGPCGPVALVGTFGRRVTLPRVYAPGEVLTLRIAYSGPLPANDGGFGGVGVTTQPGTGAPLAWTLSEPYYAPAWWPCKDGEFQDAGDNRDKATLDLTVTAPAALTVVANGLRQRTEPLAGGRTRTRWRSAYPMSTYLVCFCATAYHTWTRQYDYPLPGPGGGRGAMPVEFSIYPGDDTPANRAAWELCLDMLEAYRPLYGLYPFVAEKYGIYQFPFQGGQEHQTNTGQGGFWEYVTAHELGHQWWGDHVTCRTWHDIWLNEGFATYTEALWAEHKPGSPGAPALHAAMAARRPSRVDDSVYCPDVTNVYRVFSYDFTYLKAAWVLHQLRHVVGDERFFSILASYRAAFRGSAASTADFLGVASGVAGRDLSWFFGEWVYGVGAPRYEYGWRAFSAGGRVYIALHLVQTQEAPSALFTMPLDVRVDWTADGSGGGAGGGAGSGVFTIWNDAGAEDFVIALPPGVASPGRVAGVTLDPLGWVLATGKSLAAHIPGPPVIVAAVPAPGSLVGPASCPEGQACGGVSAVRFTFSEPVAAGAGEFVVSGPGGTVPFTLTLSAAGVADLGLAAPLPPGLYTVRVGDGVWGVATGLALDGEIGGPDAPVSSIAGSRDPLPSGDGRPGGGGEFTFGVACRADFDADGEVNANDLSVFLNAWYLAITGGRGAPGADANGDGEVNANDVGAFINFWYAGVTVGC